MNKAIKIQDLGLKDYKETWEFQEVLFKKTVDLKVKNRREQTAFSTPNHLLFVSHPHVYTLGKSGDLSNLLISNQELDAKGVHFYKINRGGDITYHGPGQIVGYPILDLENFFTDIHKYLRLLEETIIRGHQASSVINNLLHFSAGGGRKTARLGLGPCLLNAFR